MLVACCPWDLLRFAAFADGQVFLVAGGLFPFPKGVSNDAADVVKLKIAFLPQQGNKMCKDSVENGDPSRRGCMILAPTREDAHRRLDSRRSVLHVGKADHCVIRVVLSTVSRAAGRIHPGDMNIDFWQADCPRFSAGRITMVCKSNVLQVHTTTSI